MADLEKLSRDKSLTHEFTNGNQVEINVGDWTISFTFTNIRTKKVTNLIMHKDSAIELGQVLLSEELDLILQDKANEQFSLAL